MRKIIALVGAAAAVAAIALGGFAVAGDASAAERDFAGHGELYARGSGIANLAGDGFVEIHGFGAGTVVICGAERIEARGDGDRSVLPDGCVRFVGWKGGIRAPGDDMRVHMEGRRIEFIAGGEGSVHLKGHGVFKVNGHSGRWTPEGVEVRF